MMLDASTFPLVWMGQDAEPGQAGDGELFGSFEALLQKGQAFVLLAEGGPGGHEHRQGDRKRLSLWMKRHRRELALVKAMIVIEPSLAKRLTVQAFATIFAKFWGYPLLWADTRETAVAMATALLAAMPAAAQTVHSEWIST